MKYTQIGNLRVWKTKNYGGETQVRMWYEAPPDKVETCYLEYKLASNGDLQLIGYNTDHKHRNAAEFEAGKQMHKIKAWLILEGGRYEV